LPALLLRELNGKNKVNKMPPSFFLLINQKLKVIIKIILIKSKSEKE
jgi:hypothetical protein